MKYCTIMDYCYGKNSLHFGVDPIRNSMVQRPLLRRLAQKQNATFMDGG